MWYGQAAPRMTDSHSVDNRDHNHYQQMRRDDGHMMGRPYNEGAGGAQPMRRPSKEGMSPLGRTLHPSDDVVMRVDVDVDEEDNDEEVRLYMRVVCATSFLERHLHHQQSCAHLHTLLTHTRTYTHTHTHTHTDSHSHTHLPHRHRHSSFIQHFIHLIYVHFENGSLTSGSR